LLRVRIHESLNCKTGWTSSLLAPPTGGGARVLKGGACPPLIRLGGPGPPALPP